MYILFDHSLDLGVEITWFKTYIKLLCEFGCAGRGHVLREGVSGDLGTSQGQGVDQGVVQKLVLLLE